MNEDNYSGIFSSLLMMALKNVYFNKFSRKMRCILSKDQIVEIVPRRHQNNIIFPGDRDLIKLKKTSKQLNLFLGDMGKEEKLMLHRSDTQRKRHGDPKVSFLLKQHIK